MSQHDHGNTGATEPDLTWRLLSALFQHYEPNDVSSTTPGLSAAVAASYDDHNDQGGDGCGSSRDSRGCGASSSGCGGGHGRSGYSDGCGGSSSGGDGCSGSGGGGSGGDGCGGSRGDGCGGGSGGDGCGGSGGDGCGGSGGHVINVTMPQSKAKSMSKRAVDLELNGGYKRPRGGHGPSRYRWHPEKDWKGRNMDDEW